MKGRRGSRSRTDKRLCRWYGHRVRVDEETTHDPPQWYVRCERCVGTLAGPYGVWQGRQKRPQEILIDGLYTPSPFPPGRRVP